MNYRLMLLVVLGLGMAMVTGCYRGRPSEREPIHLVQDMDNQPKYEPMEETDFFPNDAIMRVPPAGTIPLGELRGNVVFYTGKIDGGELVDSIPVSVTLPMLEVGQEQYDIYCSPCHGRVGNGQGIIVQRGYVPPPTFHDERLRTVADGHIYDVITNGIRNMPAYRYQIEVEDRWAIVAYFRALQRSQNAAAEDVPEEIRRDLRQ